MYYEKEMTQLLSPHEQQHSFVCRHQSLSVTNVRWILDFASKLLRLLRHKQPPYQRIQFQRDCPGRNPKQTFSFSDDFINNNEISRNNTTPRNQPRDHLASSHQETHVRLYSLSRLSSHDRHFIRETSITNSRGKNALVADTINA